MNRLREEETSDIHGIRAAEINNFWIIKLEPCHDTTNKMSVRKAKTLIRLCIHPVWSEYSLCTQWVIKDPSFHHVDCEDSD